MTTIRTDTNPVGAVMFAVLGGTFRVRLTEGTPDKAGRSGHVLDDSGAVIGSAHDLTYGLRGFTVSTSPFAGFVPTRQIEFV